MYSADPRQALLKDLGASKVDFVAGFYSTSLTEGVAEKRGMKPAQYIDIDCDLYVSTKDALGWAFRAGIAVPGTLIGYDDWWVLPCSDGTSRPLEVGEGLAHREIADRFDVEFACVAGPCAANNSFARTNQNRDPRFQRCGAHGTFGPIFVVVSIGQGRGAHGFATGDQGITAFLRESADCVGEGIRGAKKRAGVVPGRGGRKKHLGGS
jgi:hypothetical protein